MYIPIYSFTRNTQAYCVSTVQRNAIFRDLLIHSLMIYIKLRMTQMHAHHMLHICYRHSNIDCILHREAASLIGRYSSICTDVSHVTCLI